MNNYAYNGAVYIYTVFIEKKMKILYIKSDMKYLLVRIWLLDVIVVGENVIYSTIPIQYYRVFICPFIWSIRHIDKTALESQVCK